jgi:hypothetical protein
VQQELKTQKLSLMKLIKKYNIPIIQMTNEEYGKFLSSLEATQNNSSNPESKHQNELDLTQFYPQLDISLGKGKTLHNLIM